MNIREWLNAGKPQVQEERPREWYTSRGLPPPPPRSAQELYQWRKPPGGCQCDARLELAVQPADLADWLSRCPGCGAQVEEVKGLPYIPGVGFAKGGIDTTGYRPITPSTPAPETVPVQQSPQFLPDLVTIPVGLAPPEPPKNGKGTMNLGDLIGVVPSLCKGPYNHVAGMCIPKPDCRQRAPQDPCQPYSLIGGGGGGPGIPGITPPGFGGGGGTTPNPCPTGYSWDGQQCKKTGLGGWVEPWLPGGNTGTGTDVYGDAVLGRYGAAIQPFVEARPVRRCPPGAKLGNDGLCYNKLANGQRMWPRGSRPLLTGGEMKVLRKAKTLEKRVQKAWRAAGSPGKPRPCSTRGKK